MLDDTGDSIGINESIETDPSDLENETATDSGEDDNDGSDATVNDSSTDTPAPETPQSIEATPTVDQPTPTPSSTSTPIDQGTEDRSTAQSSVLTTVTDSVATTPTETETAVPTADDTEPTAAESITPATVNSDATTDEIEEPDSELVDTVEDLDGTLAEETDGTATPTSADSTESGLTPSPPVSTPTIVTGTVEETATDAPETTPSVDDSIDLTGTVEETTDTLVDAETTVENTTETVDATTDGVARTSDTGNDTESTVTIASSTVDNTTGVATTETVEDAVLLETPEASDSIEPTTSVVSVNETVNTTVDTAASSDEPIEEATDDVTATVDGAIDSSSDTIEATADPVTHTVDLPRNVREATASATVTASTDTPTESLPGLDDAGPSVSATIGVDAVAPDSEGLVETRVAVDADTPTRLSTLEGSATVGENPATATAGVGSGETIGLTARTSVTPSRNPGWTEQTAEASSRAMRFDATSDVDDTLTADRLAPRPAQREEPAGSRGTESPGDDEFPIPDEGAIALLGLAAVAVAGRTTGAAPLVVTGGNTLQLQAQLAIQTGRAYLDRWLRVLPGLITGYSQYDDSDPLENTYRIQLYDAITATPGLTLTKLVEETGIDRSTARYHLRILKREGLIAPVKLWGNRRLYPSRTDDVAIYAALQDEMTVAVLETIEQYEPASGTELADALDRDASTLSYHLTRLEEADLVERERAGRTVVNRLAPAARRALTSRQLESPVSGASAD